LSDKTNKKTPAANTKVFVVCVRTNNEKLGERNSAPSVSIKDFEPSVCKEKVYKPYIAGQSGKLYRKPVYKID